MVIDISRKIAVQPVIVLQAKLRTKHFSHFGSTSGEKGNFGLTIRQLLRVVKNLKESGMLDCLRLLDFYIGSMNLSTNLLAEGVGEDAQVYCELVCLGAGIKFIDAGGGLGIDYDGTKSCDSDVLVGYGLQEYASTVVQAIQFVCDSKKVKHLVICSKSGRSIVENLNDDAGCKLHESVCCCYSWRVRYLYVVCRSIETEMCGAVQRW